MGDTAFIRILENFLICMDLFFQLDEVVVGDQRPELADDFQSTFECARNRVVDWLKSNLSKTKGYELQECLKVNLNQFKRLYILFISFRFIILIVKPHSFKLQVDIIYLNIDVYAASLQLPFTVKLPLFLNIL